MLLKKKYQDRATEKQQLTSKKGPKTTYLATQQASLQSKKDKEEEDANFKKTFFLIAVPSIFDLIATLLCNVGLQYIPSSVWQMLRGAMVVFSALLSIIFLKRKLWLFNWVGIGCVIGALALVGYSCIHQPKPPGQQQQGHELFGVFIVVVAQLVQASQIVVEEFLLKHAKADPFLIVGAEGFWGLLITSIIFLPIFQVADVKGFSEDTIESLYMVTHNWQLIFTVFIYMMVIMGLNATAMMVTQQFTAVHRTILEATRTLCIWVVNLFIYYCISNNFGEVWTKWSWIELLGFVVLLGGMFIYNQVLVLSFLPDHKQLTKVLREEVNQIKEEHVEDEDLEEEAEYQNHLQKPSTRRPSLPLPPGSPYMRSPRV